VDVPITEVTEIDSLHTAREAYEKAVKKRTIFSGRNRLQNDYYSKLATKQPGDEL
jgi:hypothetical protein